ncbi:YciI family protein [Rhodococcus sp. NPDC059968]|uniref:YciI family protein n=1 Tax=Rhodococcus sp. NPDC059968 TaxID=3347017 RepID=UPI00366C73CB
MIVAVVQPVWLNRGPKSVSWVRCSGRGGGRGDVVPHREACGHDSQALSSEGTFVRYDGEGRPPVTDGPFAETKDVIAGWMVIDVDSYERALELAGELSAAPGAGGKPIHEWLELRPFLGVCATVTE